MNTATQETQNESADSVRSMQKEEAEATADADLERLNILNSEERELHMKRIAAFAEANPHYRSEINQLAPYLLAETLRNRARSEADVLETPEDTRSESLHIDDPDMRGREHNYEPGKTEPEELRTRAQSAGSNVTPEDSRSEILGAEAKARQITEEQEQQANADEVEAAVAEHVKAVKAREQRLYMDGLMDMGNPTGFELGKDEFIIPRALMQKYVEVDGKFYTKDAKSPRVMFEDQGNKLRTSTTDSEAIADMVTLAKAKQWTSLKLSGSREFRREAWLQAESQGIKTTGYTPKQTDLVTLEALRQERATNSIQPVLGRQPAAHTVNQPETAQAYEHATTTTRPVRHTNNKAHEHTPPPEPRLPHLVDHGEAPFEHKPGNKPSYFVTVENDKGEQHTTWGVDLRRAIEESGAQKGDPINIEHIGSETVRLPDGQHVKRNSWQINLDKNQPQMHVAATNRAPTHIESLQKNPALTTRPQAELERLAYWRAMTQENIKHESKAVQDAALTRFDKAAEDPGFLKRLDHSEEHAKTVVSRDRELAQSRKSRELSL
jgi:hypothetical protein